MSLISKHPQSKFNLDMMISLIEMEYPDKDTNDINTLRRLILKEFEEVVSHEEIVNHYLTKMDETDNKLQLKHLNIHVR